MGHPANTTSRPRTDLTGYIAFLLSLLITANSDAAVDAKACASAKKVAETSKAACYWSWGVCFYLDEKGNEVSKGCTANELRALAVNCHDAALAIEQQKTLCGK